MNNKSYINSKGMKVLEYYSVDSIILNMPFIMTCSQKLVKNMPYMKLEKRVVGFDIVAVRLLNFEEADGIVSLNVQELATNKTYTLSSNMEYEGNIWMWALTDIDYLTSIK